MTSAVAIQNVVDSCGPVVGNVTITPAIPMVEDVMTGRNRATWVAGDFEKIAVGFAAGAAQFVERVGVNIGDNVLDVATGTGNLAIPAAHLGGIVTGVDIAPNLIATARAKAAERKLDIVFDEGNAESLPYGTSVFKTVMSMFGVMFVPRPEKALAELLRVTRPGGRIALANWTPDGFIGKVLKTHAKHVPPPAGVPTPLLWGDEAAMHDRLDPFMDDIRKVSFTPRKIALAFPMTPGAVVELFREFYGPSVRTFAALDAAGRASLEAELVKLWTSRNIGHEGSTYVEAEYLETRLTVR
ncbi:MAG TPA: methyltransferase domain-containing protein [Vicinamibacterales bacterium]|nr:methyltransferase domain-containing protein [Vicinamibacterales bacterium]